MLTGDRGVLSMRVLLTGGTGFLGSAVLGKLSKQNHEVLALSRSAPAFPKPGPDNICWIQGDLGDKENIRIIANGFKPHVLVHLAWEGLPDYAYEMCLKNLNMTANLLVILCRYTR